MIFVTVGTHEQQFNRLVEYMDKWASKHNEKVVIQTGYSTYEPQYCEWHKFFPYQKMDEIVTEARIIITHGGPSSFIMPLQMGKTPIVVPRKHEFNEHINDHQVAFTQNVAKGMNIIITVEDINCLGKVIENYVEIVAKTKKSIMSNNHNFCTNLEKIINELLDA